MIGVRSGNPLSAVDYRMCRMLSIAFGKSGRSAPFAAVDRGDWFDRKEPLRNVPKGQRPVIERVHLELIH
jgi:predicted NUDIX family NTP pyrophosphohydrolase